MNLRIIETVLAVDTYKSYTEAAYQISLTPSAVSKHVAQLEGELGVQFFVRQTKGNALSKTREGEILIPLLRNLMENYYSVQEKVTQIKYEGDTSLNVGTSLLVGSIGESEIIAELYLRYPEITVHEICRPAQENIHQILCGVTDASFVFHMNSWHQQDFMQKTFASDRFGVIQTYENHQLMYGISRKNPLSQKKVLHREDLRGQTFIFSSAVGNRQNLISDLMRDEYEYTCRTMDYRQRGLILDFVAKDGGIIPLTCRPVKHPGVVYVPAAHWEGCSSGYFVYRKGLPSQALQKLVALVREYAIDKKDM